MSEPLLKIRNHHALVSGDPPIIEDSKPNQYIGYFENMFGEQWIFTRDRPTGNPLTQQMVPPEKHEFMANSRSILPMRQCSANDIYEPLMGSE